MFLRTKTISEQWKSIFQRSQDTKTSLENNFYKIKIYTQWEAINLKRRALEHPKSTQTKICKLLKRILAADKLLRGETLCWIKKNETTFDAFLLDDFRRYNDLLKQK